jgi:sugar/nucleoside kinase (ribokinase family)
MKIFISSTFEDLSRHRAAVSRAIEGLGHLPDRMEIFPAIPGEPLRVSLNKVKDADVFVGIYAHRYGSVPEGSEVSITEAEYDCVQQMDIPILAFISDPSHQPSDERDAGSAEKLKNLKRKIKANHVCSFFTTPDDLATKVVTGLATLFEGRWNLDPYVLVVGSASGEYVLRLDLPLKIDQKQSVDSEWLSGGSGVNYSLRLMRQGVRVIPIPSVGNDELGRQIRSELLDEAHEMAPGSSVEQFIAADTFFVGTKTTCSTIIVGEGKRTILTERTSNGGGFYQHLEARLHALMDAEVLSRVGVVVIGHIHADSDRGRPGACTRLLLDMFAGRTAIFANFGNSQICHGLDFWSDDLSKLAVLQMNLDEMRLFFRRRDGTERSLREIVDMLRDHGVTSAITLDRLGAVCTFKAERKQIFALPFRLSRIVDSTGAGDAFGACIARHLVAQVRQGSMGFNSVQSFETAVEEARFWAAYACGWPGGSSHCPNRTELEAYTTTLKDELAEEEITSDRRDSPSMLNLLDRAYRPVE